MEQPKKDEIQISEVEIVPEQLPTQTRSSSSRVQPLLQSPQVVPAQVPNASALQPHQARSYRPSTSATLDSRRYTNRIFLFFFLLHFIIVATAVTFFCFKAVQGAIGILGSSKQREEIRRLTYWLPPIEASVLLSILLAFSWQKAIRTWPGAMVKFIIWFCFFSTLAAGVLLLCFSQPTTTGLAAALILFSIGTGLYSCWVSRRIKFAGEVLTKSLIPATRFRDLNHPTYLMLGLAFIWISLWCFAVIGALNFYYPPATIVGMVLSLMWTAEVMRNVANLTVSRVIALYYLRGMQSSTRFCFHRAVSRNLGSACLGSLFVPAIEACWIIARGLNLLEGEDEFLFSCAHCCLRVMEVVFRYGNSWAFVHIAAYGRGFVAASRSTWDLFEKAGMEALVNSDITSSLCFLAGVSSGAVCAILAATWAFLTYKRYAATVSLLAFFIGYLSTRIGMALPHACVECYYVCYAENSNILRSDSTIPDRIAYIASGRDTVTTSNRIPRRLTSITA